MDAKEPTPKTPEECRRAVATLVSMLKNPPSRPAKPGSISTMVGQIEGVLWAMGHGNASVDLLIEQLKCGTFGVEDGEAEAFYLEAVARCERQKVDFAPLTAATREKIAEIKAAYRLTEASNPEAGRAMADEAAE